MQKFKKNIQIHLYLFLYILRKFFLLILILYVGCSIHHKRNNPDQNEEFVIFPATHNSDLDPIIEQLASPKFFEYTQAARKLIEKGPDILPYLSQKFDTMRESDNTLIPVCQMIAEIIIQEQSDGWLLERWKICPYPKLRELYVQEITRRNSTIKNIEE